MQVSVETTSPNERKMTIGVPAEQVDSEVEKRLKDAAKTIRLNGFRPGKVPFKVVKKRFGLSVRQEVLNEVMRDHYVQAISKEDKQPVGMPSFEPKQIEEGQDIEFVATYEVMPELELADVSTLTIEQPDVEIKDKDIKNMIDMLRRQHGDLKEMKRKLKKKDIATIDFKGFIGDEQFDGGTGNGHRVTIGEGRMIPGFEEGLVGAKVGEDVELNLTFPEDYGKEDLAGKDVRFEVNITKTEELKLPEMDQTFFEKYGVESDSEEEFTKEVTSNMERELANAVSNKLKEQMVEKLLETNEISAPSMMVAQEIERLKAEMVQQYGGGQQMDLSSLPNELFEEKASKRVVTGMIFEALIKQLELSADEDKVNAKLDEIASTYESPEEIKEHYQQPENRRLLESSVLEDALVEAVLAKAKVKKKKMSYDDVLKAQGA